MYKYWDVVRCNLTIIWGDFNASKNVNWWLPKDLHASLNQFWNLKTPAPQLFIVVFNSKIQMEFEQMVDALEFKLQPKVFVEYSSTLRAHLGLFRIVWAHLGLFRLVRAHLHKNSKRIKQVFALLVNMPEPNLLVSISLYR